MILAYHHKHVITTELYNWFFAFWRLLNKLILADLIGSFVIEWLVYLIVGRQLISKPSKDEGGDLRVIICGISRSGTTSLQHAMNILGLPCFHGVNLMNPTQCKLFRKAYRSGRKEDWDRVLNGYRSIADFPAAGCYKQLVKLYPNAKVILNTRDPQGWYKSFSQTILRTTKLGVFFNPPLALNCVNELLYEGLFQGKIEDKKLAMKMYTQHIKAVKAYVHPISKLLMYEFGEDTKGWAPLCEFLGVEVPHVPFPYSNDSKTYKNFIIYLATIHISFILSYFILFF